MRLSFSYEIARVIFYLLNSNHSAAVKTRKYTGQEIQTEKKQLPPILLWNAITKWIFICGIFFLSLSLVYFDLLSVRFFFSRLFITLVFE